MENTGEKKSKLDLFDTINESLQKANAVVRLMAYASMNNEVTLNSELLWAAQIHGCLIEQAEACTDQLYKLAVDELVSNTTGEATA